MAQRTKMSRHRRWRAHRPISVGAPAGTLVPEPASPAPVMRVLAYGPHECVEQEIRDAREVAAFLGRVPVTWVDVDGLGDIEQVKRLGEVFHLHPLALEDVVNVHQRAKVEQYGEQLFIVVRMVSLRPQLDSEQLSLFLGRNFVLTFQEAIPGDCLGTVRDQVRKGLTRLRHAGSDHLVYALLDAVIDGYFPILEDYGERLEMLEDEVVGKPDEESLARIHAVKHDLRALRRLLWPLRDAVNALMHDTSGLMQSDTHLYLRDCYDHCIRLIDLVETYRELGSDLTDLYLSSINNRMNEIMKILTMVTTLFVPLTLVSGIYGMNFHHMPELAWPYGYPLALAGMGGIALGLLWFFRRKGWIGQRRDPAPVPSGAVDVLAGTPAAAQTNSPMSW